MRKDEAASGSMRKYFEGLRQSEGLGIQERLLKVHKRFLKIKGRQSEEAWGSMRQHEETL